MPERVGHGNVASIVGAIAHQYAFSVAHDTELTWEVPERRVVSQPQRDRLGQPPRWVGDTEEQVGERAAATLAEQPSLENRRYALGPVGNGDRSAVGQH